MKTIFFFKHLFIPHKDNDYKPHFLREHTVLSLLIISVLLLVLSYTSYTIIRTTVFGSNLAVTVLTDLTNQVRREHNLPPLTRNNLLEKAATMKKEDMLTRHYFSHYAPDGVSPWYWITQAGYRFSFAGENLAFNFSNSQSIVDAWLASEKHRANILNKDYQDTGISVVRLATSSSPLFFIVQMFGAPLNPTNTLQNNTSNEQPHWYAKILFDTTYYVSKAYIGLVVLILVALFLMIFIEIKKQHPRHILYGVFLIIIVSLCIIINARLL